MVTTNSWEFLNIFDTCLLITTCTKCGTSNTVLVLLMCIGKIFELQFSFPLYVFITCSGCFVFESFQLYMLNILDEAFYTMDLHVNFFIYFFYWMPTLVTELHKLPNSILSISFLQMSDFHFGNIKSNALLAADLQQFAQKSQGHKEVATQEKHFPFFISTTFPKTFEFILQTCHHQFHRC